MGKTLKSVFAALALVLGAHSISYAQGTAFTYQGRLNTDGSPATGTYDFRFSIAADASGSNILGSPVLADGVPVAGGLFARTLDFGAGVFTGENLWLQIEVKTNGAVGYTTLSPLQPITPTPYAVFANTASNLTGSLSASQIAGTLLNSSLPANASFAGTVSASSLAGDGANVTNVNAALLNGKTAASFWQTGGNSGTAPTNGNFLGTTDNQPLDIRVNNLRALRIEPDPRNMDAANFVGGYISNRIEQPASGGDVIAGGGYWGGPNIIRSNSSGVFIGGGSANQIGPNVNDVFIGGGYGNTIQSSSGLSTIAGGGGNTIQTNVPQSFIGGGYGNTIQSSSGLSTIAGGGGNTIQSSVSQGFIGGGNNNTIQFGGSGSIIVGGTANIVHSNATGATVVGGYANENSAINTFIGGGVYNSIASSAGHSAIGGGYQNNLSSPVTFIGGGYLNSVGSLSDYGAVVGGIGNQIGNSSPYSIVGGGYGNWISGAYYGVVVGGVYNNVQPGASASFVGGGGYNSAGAVYSTISGGEQNTIGTNSDNSTIAGGAYNSVQTNSIFGTISGGVGNEVSGSYSTIPGGYFNIASGANSFAAGTYARALHPGAFVLSDSVHAYFYSTTSNQLSARFGGGVRFETGGNGLNVDGSPVLLGGGSGDGGGLYNLNPAYLNSGTAGINISGNAATATSATTATTALNFTGNVSDGQLSGNIARLNGTNNFSGTNNFAGVLVATNANNLIKGTFSGDGFGLTNLNLGSVGLNASNVFGMLNAGNIPNLDASKITSGTVAWAQLPAGLVTNNQSGVLLTGTFSGTGSNLTALNASQLASGTVPLARLSGITSSQLDSATWQLATNVAGGSANYVQNQNAVAQPASFNISGTATAGSLVTSNAQFTGLFRSGSEAGTAEAPTPAGLVVRRVNSITSSSNSVVAVARTVGNANNITLVRDGTTAGFQIQYPASPGFLTIACMGMDNTGTQRNFYTTVGSGAAGTVQIYSNSQNIVHFQCTFGITFTGGNHLTRVTLSRYMNDNFWSGDLVSTYNQ